jgi:hypothetical protein
VKIQFLHMHKMKQLRLVIAFKKIGNCLTSQNSNVKEVVWMAKVFTQELEWSVQWWLDTLNYNSIVGPIRPIGPYLTSLR